MYVILTCEKSTQTNHLDRSTSRQSLGSFSLAIVQNNNNGNHLAKSGTRTARISAGSRFFSPELEWYWRSDANGPQVEHVEQWELIRKFFYVLIVIWNYNNASDQI